MTDDAKYYPEGSEMWWVARMYDLGFVAEDDQGRKHLTDDGRKVLARLQWYAGPAA